MSLSSAVDWWEEWQLRILVLGSLFIQYLLLFSAAFRKFAIPSWYRSIIWLAYQGSDAVAIYALATLFNRQRSQDHGTSANNSSILEVVWAPVLLMHLGGQDLITAYNIEDNELWTRHLLTAVSQVTVAIYVFCKSWPGGDKRLLQASILLFVPGILKCIEKPWALKSASINSLVSSSGPPLSNASRKGEINSLRNYVQKAVAFVQANPHCQAQEGGAVDLETDNYLPRAQGEDGIFDQANHQPRAEEEAVVLDLEADSHLPDQVQREDYAVGLVSDYHPQTSSKWLCLFYFCKNVARRQHQEYQGRTESRRQVDALFVDLVSPYPDRISVLKSFLVLDEKQVYALLQKWLFNVFDLLYTKRKMRAPLEDKKAETSFLESFSNLMRVSAPLLPWIAIILFYKSSREAYDDKDAMVTFALLLCTAVLEFCSAYSAFSQENVYSVTYTSGIYEWATQWQLVNRAVALYQEQAQMVIQWQWVKKMNAQWISVEERWSERKTTLVCQYTLVGFFARNKRHNWKMFILNFFNCKNFVDQIWSMKPCNSSFAITELALRYVKKGWEDQIKDPDSYWKFNDRRGQWTLQINKCDQDLGCSLRRPFDESVLLWHIATDFCFYYMGGSANHQCDTGQCIQDASGEGHGCAVRCERSPHHKRAVQCREISNYMMYLLFVKPEMLLPGTRRNLFTAANAELKKILKDDNPSLKKILKGDKPSLMEILKCDKPFCKLFTVKRPSLKEIERGFTQRIITRVQPTENREQVVEHTNLPLDAKTDAITQEGFVHDAWNLAAGLLRVGDDEKIWEVIEGVWVEMLCFSASRCRGYLHAKSLGTGGELLTYIWLLLAHMGMETLPERLQRTELSSGEGNAGAPLSISQIPVSEDPPPLTCRRPHEAAAAAGASTSRPQEIQPAE